VKRSHACSILALGLVPRRLMHWKQPRGAADVTGSLTATGLPHNSAVEADNRPSSLRSGGRLQLNASR
jgi:hypothetical protein